MSFTRRIHDVANDRLLEAHEKVQQIRELQFQWQAFCRAEALRQAGDDAAESKGCCQRLQEITGVEVCINGCFPSKRRFSWCGVITWLVTLTLMVGGIVVALVVLSDGASHAVLASCAALAAMLLFCCCCGRCCWECGPGKMQLEATTLHEAGYRAYTMCGAWLLGVYKSCCPGTFKDFVDRYPHEHSRGHRRRQYGGGAFEIVTVPAQIMGAMFNYMYILIDLESGETALVDPGCPDEIMARFDELAAQHKAETEGTRVLSITTILTTHKHHDHAMGNAPLVERLGPLRVVCAQGEHVAEATDELPHGGKLMLGANTSVEVIETPGHTKHHACFHVTKAVETIADVGLEAEARAEDAIDTAGNGTPRATPQRIVTASRGMLGASGSQGSPGSPLRASTAPGITLTLEFEREAIQIMGEPAQQLRLRQLAEQLPCTSSTSLCPQELTLKVEPSQLVLEFLQSLEQHIPKIRVAVDDKELLIRPESKPRFDALTVSSELTFETLQLSSPILRLLLYESDDPTLPISVGDTGAVFTGDILFVAGLGALFEGTCEDWLDSMALLKVLPKETELFCGHEYTEFFIPFAGWLEPYNQQVAARLDAIIQRRFGVPWPLTTVPSTIGTEVNTNPFLRCTDPELMKRIGMFIDLEGQFDEKAVLQKLLELLKSSVDMWQFSVPSSSQVAHLQSIEQANAKQKAQLLQQIGEFETPTLDQIASCIDCDNHHHDDEEEGNPVTIEMDLLDSTAAAAEGEEDAPEEGGSNEDAGAVALDDVEVGIALEPGVQPSGPEQQE